MSLRTSIEARAAQDWVGMTLGEVGAFVDRAKAAGVDEITPVEVSAKQCPVDVDSDYTRLRIIELSIEGEA